jgi:hypothetical protein
MVENRRLWTLVLPVLMTVLPRTLTAQATSQELAWAHADSVALVGEGKVGLRTYAWRDFMPRPGGETSGSGLMVNLQIRALDDRSLPRGLAVDSAWIRCAEGHWSTAPSHEPRPELANGLDLMLRGGPVWKTNQTIDVLVRLRLPNGEARYLEARNQPIGRTE